MPKQMDQVANVYARSLFELCADDGGTEKAQAMAGQLEQVCELVRGDASFAEFLKTPIIDQGRREAALKQIFQGRIDDLLLRFMLVLNVKGRLGHLSHINDAFDHQLQEACGRVEVDVYTPEGQSLSPEISESLKQRIKSTIGKEAILHTYQDDSMIGGIKLRIGDELIDGSIQTQLRRLHQEMIDSGSARIREQYTDFMDESA